MRVPASLGWFLILALAGCGGSDPSPAGDGSEQGDGAGSETGMPAEPDESTVQLTLDGVHEVLSGGAQLEVQELDPLVRLVVTAVFATNHDNLLQFQLGVQGVEHAMGAHSEALSSAVDATAQGVAYVDHVSYFSQSGSLDVTLSGDGNIEGQFSAELVADPSSAPESAEPLSLSGSFAGTWALLCRSPVLILPGDHSIADSPYCRSLQF